MILNSLHASKVTGGASGALRQEFREPELELLDDITTLRFNGKFPTNIAMADCRNTVIALFREYKGLGYVPSKVQGDNMEQIRSVPGVAGA